VKTTDRSDAGRRIVGQERATLGKDYVRRYTAGESIRMIAADTGRSYGFVHRVLTENGVKLRKRGGARARRSPSHVGSVKHPSVGQTAHAQTDVRRATL